MIHILSTTGIWTQFEQAQNTKNHQEQGVIGLYGEHGEWVASVLMQNTILVSRIKPFEKKGELSHSQLMEKLMSSPTQSSDS